MLSRKTDLSILFFKKYKLLIINQEQPTKIRTLMLFKNYTEILLSSDRSSNFYGLKDFCV